ncbi:DCC1-like thiol-disulfide oxidoreductase family protein [Demequina sp. TTPB684]|uniref:thiol-disulfide oxidoreductase DCC family protein n=1 Tax=unclassified Demequina TaxID=2620311 RepID=UPI001CF355BC|nr:DCC1-like thiol-disulfide oxidoreductase family protein [Demequina sp. TMPB413]MCB2412026.1 DCC1-like thiol-disulfide oxidoreductase family protein [Demequina sp. TTPB684]UPU88807.1 DCC1-like thiol-disulfide oxidoreductase family protein [Demequina sp. TMPB413]
MSTTRAIVVFDGECALCNGFVAWLVRHDTHERFLLAGSAGEVGAAVVAKAGLAPEITASTLLVWDGRAHVQSDAVIAVARGVPWPWRAAAAMRIVPPPWRDAVYRFVASRRPRMDAEDPSCGVPPADLVHAWRARLATLEDLA